MIHYMNLHARPFEMIMAGVKTIELRLMDEKRKLIHVGDTIVFTKAANPEHTLRATVKALHPFPSFEELYRALPLELCGYLPEELAEASAKDMEQYYSAEKQQKYGVIGIELVITERQD